MIELLVFTSNPLVPCVYIFQFPMCELTKSLLSRCNCLLSDIIDDSLNYISIDTIFSKVKAGAEYCNCVEGCDI